MSLLLFLSILVARIGTTSAASAPGDVRPDEKRVYTTSRTAVAPTIDGRLDDDAWREAPWADGFLQQIPRQGEAPSQPTAFSILYDDTFLYVAIRAFDDDPAQIERRGGRRDEIVGDVVGIAFDSYHDLRTAYEFNLTAAGTKIDLMHKPPKVWDTTWDAVWDGAVGMEDSAWVAEMRIPFSQLRFGSEDEQVWGLHLWRWIHRFEEESQFNLIPSDAAVMVPYFGELHGISGLRPPLRLELLPYVTARGSTSQPIDGDPFADGRDAFAGAGLDAKIGLSSAFTMDLTINPDFGQVEADPSTINLTAFETFYEEKRPFFLEGSNLFAYEFEGEEIFYSRRIGSAPRYTPASDATRYVRMPDATTILAAAKVTGKTAGGLSVGILESLTAAESATIQEPGGRYRQPVEPLTNYFVARLESEHNDGRTVYSGMATAVNRRLNDPALSFLVREAYTGGLSFSHYLPGHTYYTKLNLVGSTVSGSTEAIQRIQENSLHYFQRPDADYLELDSTRTGLRGTGGSIEIGRAGMGRWRFSEEFSWQSPGLDFGEAGFMRTPADRLNLESVLNYVVTEETDYFRSYSVGIDHSGEWSFGGDMNGAFARLRLEGQLKNYWRLSASAIRNLPSLDRHLLRGGASVRVPASWQLGGTARSDSRRALSYGFGWSSLWTDGTSTARFSASPDVDLRVSELLSLRAGFSYEWSRDELQFVTQLPVNGDARFILGTIDQRTASITLRASYSLRPNLVIQFYGQPFVSSGSYDDYKSVTRPRADDYADRFALLDARPQGDPAGPTTIAVDEDADGTVDYQFRRPDFTFREFRSNLVLRWEYRPGSNLYLVWSQMRSAGSDDGSFHLTQDLRRLYDIYPHNIFAIKLSYWLGT